MNQSTRALYAVAFAVGILGLGFGIFLTYDSFRLFLALGGFSILLILFFNMIYGIATNGNIKIEHITPEPKTPAVKNALYTENREELPEIVHGPYPRPNANCGFCHLFIGAGMKMVTVGLESYHEDCWAGRLRKIAKTSRLEKGD